MLIILHRYKDNSEVVINSDYFLMANQYENYLEIVLLSDECLEVKENLQDFLKLMNFDFSKIKKEKYNFDKDDAVSKDIKKNRNVLKKKFKKHMKDRKKNNRIMKRSSHW